MNVYAQDLPYQTGDELIDEVANDTNFELMYKFLHNPSRVPGIGPPRNYRLLAQPLYEEYWIEYFISTIGPPKNKNKLPFEMNGDLSALEDAEINMKLEIKSYVERCDRDGYLEEVRRLNYLIDKFEYYKKNAKGQLQTINAAYDDRINSYFELMDMESDIVDMIKNNYYLKFRWWYGNLGPNFVQFGTVGAIIGIVWDFMKAGTDIVNINRASKYGASALNVLKLKLLYEQGVIRFFDKKIYEVKSLQQSLAKYDSYFISDGNCAELVSVENKLYDDSGEENGVYNFEWSLVDSKKKPIKAVIPVRISRDVGYDLDQVREYSKTFNRIDVFRTNYEGKIKIKWEQSDSKQRKVTFSIKSINHPNYFYDGDGDSLYTMVNETKLGQLNMKAFDKDGKETEYFVRIIPAGSKKSIKSGKGMGLTEDLPPGNYDLIFSIIGQDDVNRNIEIIEGETAEIIVDFSEKEYPVPPGWARGTLYNSNDGFCSSLEGKYLVFMNAGKSLFKNLKTGEINQFMVVAPGEKLEVAAPIRSAWIRVFATNSYPEDPSKVPWSTISTGTVSQLVNGWWYSAGCKDGTHPVTPCDNGNGGGGTCKTYGEDY